MMTQGDAINDLPDPLQLWKQQLTQARQDAMVAIVYEDGV